MAGYRWALGLLCGLLVSALPAWTQTPQAAIGQVKSTTGDVTLVRQQRSQPATPGLVLHEGDALHTGDTGSSVGVILIDDTRLALGPRSRLELRRFRWNPTTQAGGMQAYLDAGTMAVQSGLLGQRQTGNTLAVTTPRATVRVTDAEVALRVTGKE